MKANEKIHETAIKMRSPKDGAEAPEMALSTLVMGLGSETARAYMAEAQESGDLDQFMGALARWILGHRSDEASLLVVVELPRNRDLPPGTILARVDEAKVLALGPIPELS
jgi:hypothetical protein